MARWIKVLLTVFVVVLAGLMFELVREYAVYWNERWKLNAAAQQLKYDMGDDQVLQIMGKPTAKIDKTHYESRYDSEVWNWRSAENQGYLWQKIGLMKPKPPLEITAFTVDHKLTVVIIENDP